MSLEKEIRKLAKSQYWQTIYSNSKSSSSVKLFENETNFSGIQVLFLYWLNVYSMLYDEYYQLEHENLDLEVIKNDDRCDAFLFWRRKEQEKKIRKYKSEERKSNRKQEGSSFKIFKGTIDKKGEE